MKEEGTQFETDPRFPSGPWVGFFLQKLIPGKHQMELRLQFHKGDMRGEGRDFVGQFLITGKYTLEDGRCHWHKRYLGKHDVFYQGYNEGKGIWGFWEMVPPETPQKGGFHIWPEGMGDPTQPEMTEAADIPVEEEAKEELELVAPVAHKSRPNRRRGGIGRHSGLKIR